jgi:ABC-type transporter Mla MlaB component
MIHISKYNEGKKTLHIQMEGTLDREHVIALNEVVREADQHEIPYLVLHCSGLLGVDEAGKAFLHDLRARGAKLLDLPVTVSWKLYATDSQTQRKA